MSDCMHGTCELVRWPSAEVTTPVSPTEQDSACIGAATNCGTNEQRMKVVGG